MSGFLSFIKKSIKVILWTMAGLLFVIILLVGLIQLPYIQNKVLDAATTYVSHKTNTRVEIGYISIAFPYSVVLNDVYLEDNKKDTLLYAGKTSLHIGYKALFHQRLHIRDFLLQDVYLNVYNSATDSLFNYQFLIDALSDTTAVETDTTKTAGVWNIYAEKFRLKNIRLRYADQWNKLKAATQIQLFELKKTNIQLENTALDIENIVLKADKLHYRSGEVKTASNQFNPDDISLANIDLKARNLSFAPGKTSVEIQQLTADEKQQIAIRKLNANFSMDEQTIKLDNFILQTNQSSIQARILVNYPSPESLTDSISKLWVDARIRQASFSKREIKYLAGTALPDKIELPDRINLNINFKGGLQAFDASVNLKSDFGDASLLAILKNNERFKADLGISQFELGKLLKNEQQFGPISLTAQVKGNGTDLKTTAMNFQANVPQLSLNQYEYQNLALNGSLIKQILDAGIRMQDENLNVDLKALANLTKGKERLQLDMNLENIDFNALKLMEDSLRVKAKFQADITGQELKNLNGKLDIRDLSIMQNNKTYSFDSILVKATKLTDQTEVKLRSDILEMDTYLAFKKDHIRLHFNPDHFLLMQKHWKFNPEHYILFGEKGFIIHDLQMQHEEGILGITSVNERYKDDIRVTMQHFSLDEISGLINQENKLVGGILNGNVLLKMQEGFGIVADAGIDSLILMDVPIGNLRIIAQNPVASRFDIQADISGADNNLQASGFYDTAKDKNNFHLKANIASLGMKTIEAFAAEQLRASSGHVSGQFDVSGDLNKPLINGELSFHEAITTPVMLNNPLSLANETIRVDNEGVYFKQFTIRDINKQPLTLDGSIRMKEFSGFKFNLDVDANHFQVFNTTARDNDLFYGRLLTDTKIRLRGTMEAPDVSADVSLLEGSHVSFIVPRTELNTYKGEDVVKFVSGEERKDSLITTNKIESGFTGINLSSVIQVDKNATLRLFMDPTSSDSLVVKGQADLNLTMDRSGKMSLTGSYNLEEGSYQLTFESLIRKKFDIVKGSTIVWNGDPMDANVNINAAYNVRTAPYNLVADQLGGLTENQRRPYLQAYPFILLLKMRGELLQPEIGFEIQLPTENQQILGGAVQQKLDQLNEDPSALNKQVFALLLLNRFAQENPLQTESAGTPAMLRSTVSNFLSEQLNKLSASFIPGLEMNFDLQSYEDYSGGEAEGRTELSVGVKKELFDERLSVQVGGTVELEGEKATQNQASDIASDVIIEYKLTKDGRYRLKGFRKNQYEGLIDGQLTETGIGAVLVREFNRLKELFK